MSKILLVSHNLVTTNLVRKNLDVMGHIYSLAPDSKTAIKIIQKKRFDVVMIDLNLSGESGLALYRTIRQAGMNIPVLMMGDDDLDEIILKDWSTKNYDYIIGATRYAYLDRKLQSCVRIDDDKFIRFDEMCIDVREQIVTFGEELINLSSMELDVLVILAQRGGAIIHPRKLIKILEREGKFHAMTTFYCISLLREKMKKLTNQALEIRFIENQGYKLSRS